VQQQLNQPAAKPASQQKSRVAFVRSHPLPLDASCCSDAAAEAIRTAAAAATVADDDSAADDTVVGSEGQLGLQEQQAEVQQLQQVRATCRRAAGTASSSSASTALLPGTPNATCMQGT
jgi:hypothetical protein